MDQVLLPGITGIKLHQILMQIACLKFEQKFLFKTFPKRNKWFISTSLDLILSNIMNAQFELWFRFRSEMGKLLPEIVVRTSGHWGKTMLSPIILVGFQRSVSLAIARLETGLLSNNLPIINYSLRMML